MKNLESEARKALSTAIWPELRTEKAMQCVEIAIRVIDSLHRNIELEIEEAQKQLEQLEAGKEWMLHLRSIGPEEVPFCITGSCAVSLEGPSEFRVTGETVGIAYTHLSQNTETMPSLTIDKLPTIRLVNTIEPDLESTTTLTPIEESPTVNWTSDCE